MKKFWAILGILLWAISLYHFKLGYETSLLTKYRFVGGDAFNYIINAELSISSFLLACTCVICGFLCFIIHYLSNKKADTKNDIEHKQEN